MLFLFAGLLLVPAAVEFGHIFSDHHHAVCNHYSDSHFHQKNFECDLFHFQKAPLTYSELYEYELWTPPLAGSESRTHYSFLSSYTPTYFSLRAPPAHV